MTQDTVHETMTPSASPVEGEAQPPITDPEPAEAPSKAAAREVDEARAKQILEGVLFVTDQPVMIKRLKDALPGFDAAAIRELLDELTTEYEDHHHAFRIQEVAGGFQLVTDPELAPWVKRALELPASDTLRKPALETLAIVAYRQPITKAEIEVIRGVDGGATLDTLLDRQLVRVVGRKETPGRPLLYGTTTEFMRHFGLKDLGELPPVTDVSTLPLLEARPIVPPGQVPAEIPSEPNAAGSTEPQASAQEAPNDSERDHTPPTEQLEPPTTSADDASAASFDETSPQ